MADPTPDLGDLLRTGAVLCGVRVTAVRIETTDGRVQRLQLPVLASGEASEEKVIDDPFAPEKLTRVQRDVVQAIDEMKVGTVLSYAELATKAGCGNSDKFRTFVKEYATATGRLEPHHRGWEKLE